MLTTTNPPIASTTSQVGPSPILLQRAQGIAAEHNQLSQKNAESYDVSVAKRIGELSGITEALKEYETAQNVLPTFLY